jgi:hypothetical protein
MVSRSAGRPIVWKAGVVRHPGLLSFQNDSIRVSIRKLFFLNFRAIIFPS